MPMTVMERPVPRLERRLCAADRDIPELTQLGDVQALLGLAKSPTNCRTFFRILKRDEC